MCVCVCVCVCSNCHAIRKTQRSVATAVRQAKDKWVMSVGEEAEEAKKDGRVRWKCIHKLQGPNNSRWPVTTSVVLDEQGNLVESVDGLCALLGEALPGYLEHSESCSLILM